MATYIRDDSLDNLQQSMSLLAQLAQRRKAQDLETAIAINRMGKNKEAEELILSSQRGLLGNLFGDEAKAREFTSAFSNLAKPDMEIKPEQYSTDAVQGGILAQIAKENPDMYRYMTKQDQLQPGLAGMVKSNNNIDPFQQSESANNLADKIAAYKTNEAANKDIRAYNNSAAKYNASNPKYETKLNGDEDSIVNAETRNAMTAIRNSRSQGEAMARYNEYVNSVTSKKQAFQHDFKPMPPEYFGIGGKRGGGKKIPVNVFVPGRKDPQVVQVPEGTADIQQYVYDNFPSMKKRLGINDINEFRAIKAANEGTGSLNPLEESRLKEQDIKNDAYYQAQAEAAYKKADSWGWDWDKDKAATANAMLSPENPYRFNEKGTIYDTRGSSNVASSEPKEPSGYKHLDKFRVK